MPSFDVVSEADAVEVRNAIDQANKEIANRFDFKGSDARVEQKDRELTTFDLPLAPQGTEFQQRVWKELQQIGYGETASYGEIAHRLGHTNAASRAVGLANGRNPIPIVIPCHRVIGADGSLTGYAGGMERKQTLLELEQDALF